MSFLPQSRIVRDLIWIGGVILVPSLFLFYNSKAVSFLEGGFLAAYSLGWLSAAVWVEFRLVQVQRMANR
jgi:hypothetical protein